MEWAFCIARLVLHKLTTALPWRRREEARVPLFCPSVEFDALRETRAPGSNRLANLQVLQGRSIFGKQFLPLTLESVNHQERPLQMTWEEVQTRIGTKRPELDSSGGNGQFFASVK